MGLSWRPQRRGPMPVHYTTKLGVVLDANASAFVTKVADAFYKAVGKDVVVTSAYRGPAEQASAMYGKFEGPEWNIYRDKKALTEIRTAYVQGKAAKASRETIIADMTAVLERQVGEHRYISSHLVATALDLRKVGFSKTEVAALVTAARENGAKVVIDEGSPPHLHVQF